MTRVSQRPGWNFSKCCWCIYRWISDWQQIIYVLDVAWWLRGFLLRIFVISCLKMSCVLEILVGAYGYCVLSKYVVDTVVSFAFSLSSLSLWQSWCPWCWLLLLLWGFMRGIMASTPRFVEFSDNLTKIRLLFLSYSALLLPWACPCVSLKLSFITNNQTRNFLQNLMLTNSRNI